MPIDAAQSILQAAIECCRGLLKTSVLIRRATTRDCFKTALLKAKEPFADQFDINHVQEKYPKLSTPESRWLLNRLGRAITSRRQFLRYCREHQDSLGASQPFSNNDNPTIPSTQQDTSLQVQARCLPLPPDGISQAGFTNPVTKASTLNPSQLMAMRNELDDDTVSRSSAAQSDFSQADSMLELPSLQAVSEGQSEFECPYCHTIQSFRRERQWR